MFKFWFNGSFWFVTFLQELKRNSTAVFPSVTDRMNFDIQTIKIM